MIPERLLATEVERALTLDEDPDLEDLADRFWVPSFVIQLALHRLKHVHRFAKACQPLWHFPWLPAKLHHNPTPTKSPTQGTPMGTPPILTTGPLNGNLPPGRHVCTRDQAKAQYVPHHDTHRQELWIAWEKLTDAYHEALGSIICCWLSGSFFTTKETPGDIDCLYIIDEQAYAHRKRDKQYKDLIANTRGYRAKQRFGIPVDPFILVWKPKIYSPGHHKSDSTYCKNRGHWDDLWSRAPQYDDNGNKVYNDISAWPQRGYLEVTIDGFR